MVRTIPLEDFFRKPEKTFIRISPDGRHLAWMEPWEHRLNVYVKNMESGEVNRITASKERDLWGYVWANDNRIIYAMDINGDENGRIYGVNTDGSGYADFTPFEGVKCGIVDTLLNDDSHILFQMNRRDRKLFDIFRLNVFSGEMNLIAVNPGNVSRWIVDHDGKLRLAATQNGLDTGMIYREDESADWKQVASYNFKESAEPLFFTFDNSAVYVASNVGRDKKAIFEYDLKTGNEGKLIFEHSEVDVSNLLFSRKLGKITGVSFTTEKRCFHHFDESRRRIQKFVDEKVPGYHNSILSFDREETKCILHSGSDKSMGSYYFLDIEKWELAKLFDASPWINEEDMAEMKPIEYTARDGLKIHGYLTLPVGVDPVNLPMIINPHGGPWSRNGWGFIPQTQFLVNRGYAVLQMNFRGSTGYGRKFLESGYGQWGLSMQDDITDGVNWAVENGIADSKRIGIYGVSYGGYATLMGIVKTPDLYAAAVDYVGVSNLFTILENLPPYWEHMREMMYERIGNPETDRERLTDTSPALNADKIKTPLFIAQGANDPRVHKTESDQVVEALKRRGIEVEYMVKDNEGHGFNNEENRFDFFRAMEKFLQHHINPSIHSM